MRHHGFRSHICLLSMLPLLAAAPAPGSETPEEYEFDVVDLIPDEPPSWTPQNIFAPITGLFLGGPGYWYDQRVIEIETTPPGAVLDLFYVRRNFQKRYEQADAPVRVILPPRIEATSRDSLMIRALLGGHRQREVQVRVRSRDDRVMIDLSPLPNSLVGFSHTYFAGRGSLSFLTREALTFRLQQSDQGLSIVLTETALDSDARESMQGVQSALVGSVKGQQLGEDLMVRVALTEIARGDAFETRSRQAVDPVRGLHLFALDLVPKDRGASDIDRARTAIARIGKNDVTGCALEFDGELRDQLDPAELARALTPNGSYTDKFMRAAMRRLGEVSPGEVIRMMDGSEFRGSIPIELMAAATQPGQAIGYLALLRTFIAELEPATHRRQTLRGLIAPEVAPSSFDEFLDAAEQRERSCGAGV